MGELGEYWFNAYQEQKAVVTRLLAREPFVLSREESATLHYALLALARLVKDQYSHG